MQGLPEIELEHEQSVIKETVAIELHGKTISIDQDASMGTGGIVWNAAKLLCDWIRTSSHEYHNIVELGSGTGIVGLSCFYRFPNARVVLTDIEPFVTNMHKIIKENIAGDRKPEIVEYRWGTHTDLCKNDFDLVILCECIYHPDLFDVLLKSMLLLNGTNTTFLIGYQKRRKGDKMFWNKCRKLFELELLLEKEKAFLYKAKIKAKIAPETLEKLGLSLEQ
jgi:predicted nicotinamide N-methyase